MKLFLAHVVDTAYTSGMYRGLSWAPLVEVHTPIIKWLRSCAHWGMLYMPFYAVIPSLHRRYHTSPTVLVWVQERCPMAGH